MLQQITLTGLNPEQSDLISTEYFQKLNWTKMTFPYVATVVDVTVNTAIENGDSVSYIVDVDGELVNISYFLYNPKELIDFKPLCERLDTLLGVEGTYILWDQKKPTIKTPAFEIGVFAEAVCKCEVGFFNFGYNPNTQKIWGTIHLDYESYGGGTNGMCIMDVWYNYNGLGWAMETGKEKRAKHQR